MENKEEILKALKVIQDTCHKHSHCNECPFGTKDGYCIIQEQSPEDWKIGEETAVWRAFK